MLYLLTFGGTYRGLPEFYGILMGPRSYGVWAGIKEGRPWALDNDCFNGGFDPDAFFRKMDILQPYSGTCLFATLPDVVGSAEETLRLYAEWIGRYREYPFPVAFVAQDGQELLPLPDDFDVLFVGGSTEWKLGKGAKKCVAMAKRSGKGIHVGRVNSRRRIRHCRSLGVDTVDGTFASFGRNRNLPMLTRWMEEVKAQPVLPYALMSAR